MALVRCTMYHPADEHGNEAEVTRHVVITGAAGGIGQALVSAFADAGDRIVAIDQSRGEARNGTDWIEADLADLADDRTALPILSAVKAALGGRCDVLVNNAATQRVGSFLSLGSDQWTDTLAVNLMAPVVLTRDLLPLMPHGAGVVINISSIHAHLTKAGFTAYATSKAALSGLTRALAVELGAQARFVAIEPAAIGTPMLRAGFDGDPEGFAGLEAMHPAARIGTPEEVARLALLLCDSAIGFVNGAAIGIDGGIASRLHDPA